MWHLSKTGSFFTVNHRGPLPVRELHSTDEIIVWRDPGGGGGGGILNLFSIHPARGCVTDKWYLCQTGSFSYGESPRTPPREGTSLHRRNNSVERPGGDLEPVYHLFMIFSEITQHRL